MRSTSAHDPTGSVDRTTLPAHPPTTVALAEVREPVAADAVVIDLASDLDNLSGAADRCGHEPLRRAAGAAIRALTGTPQVPHADLTPGASRVALALPMTTPAAVAAAAEGALLAAYAAGGCRSTNRAPVDQVVLLVPDPAAAGLTAALHRARVVAGAVGFARDLVNTPPGDLTPADFVVQVTAAWRERGLTAQVWDEPALRADGYGGIRAVGQGSVHPPRLLRLTYPGPVERVAPRLAYPGSVDRVAPRLALVGKGITFDSGGLSLKQAPGMAQMKFDMAGAAAVVAAGLAIADLELPVELDIWAPLAEYLRRELDSDLADLRNHAPRRARCWRPDCSSGSLCRPGCPGLTWTSPARRTTRQSRTVTHRAAPPAWPYARWCRSPPNSPRMAGP